MSDQIAAVRMLREALLNGVRPRISCLKWPRKPVIYEYVRWLNRHPEVEEGCRDNKENVDAVIELLESVAKCYAQKINAAKSKELVSDNEQSSAEARHGLGFRWFSMSASRFWPSLSDREVARQCFREHESVALAKLASVKAFSELITKLGFNQVGWDLSSGTLHDKDFAAILEFARQLEQDEGLKRILDALGRLEPDSSVSSSPLAGVLEHVFESRKLIRERLVPDVYMDVTGLELSDEIELMLPDEAVLLGNESLRSLWFARYAESQLATYRIQGTEVETVQTSVKKDRPVNRRLGPVIAMVDTSGSMSGYPEPIAKAIVLALCQMSQNRSRRIFVISFSGPGQTLDFEFTPNVTGLSNLQRFLSHSFSGGTDVNTPLAEALGKVETDKSWKQADIFVASDGGFGVSDAVVERIGQARRSKGLGVSGVLIGGYKSEFERICDQHRLYEYSTWNNLV